jgi:hypothetical protein
MREAHTSPAAGGYHCLHDTAQIRPNVTELQKAGSGKYIVILGVKRRAIRLTFMRKVIS